MFCKEVDESPSGRAGGAAYRRGERVENPDNSQSQTSKSRVRVLGLAVMALAVVAVACHPYLSFPFHKDGIESTTDKENVCVDWAVTESSSINFLTVRDTITAILENDNVGWEAATPEIDFVIAAGDCDTLSPNDRAEQEIEFRIGNFLDYGPCNLNCIRFDPFTAAPHGNWTDFTKATIFMTHVDFTGNSENFLTFVVNHETGHSIGFDDAIQGAFFIPPVDFCVGLACCLLNYKGTLVWNTSIMHNALQCADDVQRAGAPVPAQNLPWPSAFDREFAQLLTEKP